MINWNNFPGSTVRTICPRKNYNQTFCINNFKGKRMNQCIIADYESKIYCLYFAENPVRFGQLVTQKYEFFMSQDHSLPSFDKMQNHNAQESIHASFK